MIAFSHEIIELQEIMEYMKVREKVHKKTVESTYNRVFWATFAESVVLLGVSGLQLYSLTSFFEVKRYV